MERRKDSDFFKGDEFHFPPNTWVEVKRYKCTTCGHISEKPLNECPTCKNKMRAVIY